MRLTTVFNKLLSLQGVFVRDVAFEANESTLIVDVAKRGRRHRCPKCAFATAARYDLDDGRYWRHLSLGRWRVLLRAPLARLVCPTHSVITEAVPWAEHESRFTRDFEDLVAWLAKEMNKTAVTKLVHIAWETVGHIITRVVDRKLDPERLAQLYVLGVDEVSYRKGHKYLTVVANQLTGKTIWVGEGKSQAALGAFFDELGPEPSERVALATMDMSAAYVAAVKARAPNAEIVFDPFHVVKLAGEAVHDLRRTQARDRKGSDEAIVLKGARWALLKAPERLNPDEQLRLAAVARLNRDVYRGYLLKEELRMLYRCHPLASRRHLESWLAWSSRSRLRPFVRLARTLRAHFDGILAAIKYGFSNGRMEGINNKIKLLIHRAYGFHSVAALMAMVYLTCGGITLELPT